MNGPLFLNVDTDDARSYRLQPSEGGMVVTRYDAGTNQVRFGAAAGRALAADGYYSGLTPTDRDRSAFPPGQAVGVVVGGGRRD